MRVLEPAADLALALAITSARRDVALPADVVVVMLGTNDMLGLFEPKPVSLERYRTALAELAQALVRDGAAHVLLMSAPQFYQGGAKIRAYHYRNAVLEFCSAPDDAILCGPDVFSLLRPEDFADLDPHPNAEGHRKIAQALRDAIRKTTRPAR